MALDLFVCSPAVYSVNSCWRFWNIASQCCRNSSHKGWSASRGTGPTTLHFCAGPSPRRWPCGCPTGNQLPGALDQPLFLFHVAGVFGIQAALQARCQGNKPLLQRLAGSAVHGRVLAPLLLGLAQCPDDQPPVGLFPIVPGSRQPAGRATLRAAADFPASRAPGLRSIRAGLIRLLGRFMEALQSASRLSPAPLLRVRHSSCSPLIRSASMGGSSVEPTSASISSISSSRFGVTEKLFQSLSSLSWVSRRCNWLAR